MRNYLTPFRLSLVTALIAGLTVTTVAGAAPSAKAAPFTAAGSEASPALAVRTDLWEPRIGFEDGLSELAQAT